MNSQKNKETKPYFVYILKCSDGTLYTGITTDIDRRIKEHNGESLKSGKYCGAKYTRYRSPVELVYCKESPDRSTASQEEMRIKKLSRGGKEGLVLTIKSL